MPARKPRRILAAAGIIAAVLAVSSPWWLLGYHSPVAQAVYRAVSRVVLTEFPGVTFKFGRMGVMPGLRTFAIRDIRATAGGAADTRIDSVVCRYSLLPLARGRLCVRDTTIDGVRVVSDTTEPVPDCLTTQIQPVPVDVRMDSLDRFLVTNVSAVVRCRTATNAPECRITLTNAFLRLHRLPSAESSLPYSFSVFSAYFIDEGSNMFLSAIGRCSLDAKSESDVNVDLDVTATNICLPDLNPLLAGASPFLIRTGAMDYYLNMICRGGQLSGITSIKTRGLSLLHNTGSIGTGFLRLSFDAWRFLAQQRNGSIEADCNISGTISKPVVPIGNVLKDQAVGAGRNMGIKIVEKIPTGFTRNMAARWESDSADRSRYDNILKISRLDPSEQHFEKGRHYREIVRNYKLAIDEFLLQASEYPESEGLAVRALMAAADLLRNRLRDLPQAAGTLRRLVERYPKHQDADDAMLAMVEIAVEQKRYPDADVLCDEFREKFVHSELLPKIAEIKKSIADFVW
jgi:hypothetical protein